ncbi:uncharacterized protein CCOS01_05869 [Colletotrichum costaricense]|uniref:Uncharacterized protein n=1 Tax=Colletotrichum costaricense TaxID=1209916 RepID=A0AAI9Z2H5_9PEZI|nr:uncharacterized protein CCOS01_05869 [Colletotrichum costaricense]KAK1530766.1 hypothetical protein CCOS01_05869 [Colletotrichum costaricense]
MPKDIFFCCDGGEKKGEFGFQIANLPSSLMPSGGSCLYLVMIISESNVGKTSCVGRHVVV